MNAVIEGAVIERAVTQHFFRKSQTRSDGVTTGGILKQSTINN